METRYPTILPRSFLNNVSRSIVTTTAAANGWQLSASRDAEVIYSVTIAATSTIGGSSSGVVVLEIAATNSSNAGDWQEIGRITNSQAITLAVVLQSVLSVAGVLKGIVPAGWYARVRQTNSGTITATLNSGQEILI